MQSKEPALCAERKAPPPAHYQWRGHGATPRFTGVALPKEPARQEEPKSTEEADRQVGAPSAPPPHAGVAAGPPLPPKAKGAPNVPEIVGRSRLGGVIPDQTDRPEATGTDGLWIRPPPQRGDWSHYSLPGPDHLGRVPFWRSQEGYLLPEYVRPATGELTEEGYKWTMPNLPANLSKEEYAWRLFRFAASSLSKRRRRRDGGSAT